MPRLLAGIAALLLGLCAAPAFAADDPKKDPPPPDAKKDADAPPAEKPIKVGVVSGKLVEVNETAKSVKLEVMIEVQKPNLGEMQAVQNCRDPAANRRPRRRDYNAVASLQQQILQHKLNSITIEKKTQNMDYTSTDDVKVRLSDPPVAYDDKGNIKKRTAKELTELKGNPKDPDSKLAGYPGAFTDLRTGSYVKVTLVKKKEVPHTGPKPKDADPVVKDDNLPEASHDRDPARPDGAAEIMRPFPLPKVGFPCAPFSPGAAWRCS